MRTKEQIFSNIQYVEGAAQDQNPQNQFIVMAINNLTEAVLLVVEELEKKNVSHT